MQKQKNNVFWFTYWLNQTEKTSLQLTLRGREVLALKKANKRIYMLYLIMTRALIGFFTSVIVGKFTSFPSVIGCFAFFIIFFVASAILNGKVFMKKYKKAKVNFEKIARISEEDKYTLTGPIVKKMLA